MLKTQRAARQVKHPHAIHTPKGQLACSLCKTQIKSDGQWEQHLRSQQHCTSLKHAKSQVADAKALNNSSKKRKADDDDDDVDDESTKRVRSDSLPSRPRAAVDELPTQTSAVQGVDDTIPPDGIPDTLKDPDASGRLARIDENDEFADELAAFDRDMNALDEAERRREQRPPHAPKAYEARSTISAKPLTAAELAARDREEKSAQRSARDVELEEEREEAAGQMQDEFDRMNRLDEKIQALRARKNALVKSNPEDTAVPTSADADPPSDDVEELGESESENELDEWAFGKPAV